MTRTIPSLLQHSRLAILATGIAAALASSSASAQTDVLSVQLFYGFGSSTRLTSEQTAGVVPVSNWNVLGSSATSGLIDSEGEATNYTVSFTTGDGWETGAGGADANHALLSSKLDAVNGGTQTFTIGGVGAGTYDLFLYTVNNGTPPGDYSAGGTTYRITQQIGSAFDGTFIRGTSTDPNARDTANYVMFSGLSATDGNIAFQITNPQTTGNSSINGFQLVAVPEPSTAVAMFAGVGMLLGARRRPSIG